MLLPDDEESLFDVKSKANSKEGEIPHPLKRVRNDSRLALCEIA